FYSMNTLNGSLTIPVSMSYHPTSVAEGEIAPYTGLGWSLIAGGSISRTVRSIPDEYFEFGSPSGNVSTKVGLFYDEHSSTGGVHYVNHYNEAVKELNEENFNIDNLKKFKFDSFEKGYFDTEYDLYQYNVMGISGRFMVKKVPDAHELEIVRLDTNTQYDLEVLYTYSNGNSNIYRFHIDGFILTDTSGFRYFLMEKEMNERTSNLS